MGIVSRIPLYAIQATAFSSLAKISISHGVYVPFPLENRFPGKWTSFIMSYFVQQLPLIPPIHRNMKWARKKNATTAMNQINIFSNVQTESICSSNPLMQNHHNVLFFVEQINQRKSSVMLPCQHK